MSQKQSATGQSSELEARLRCPETGCNKSFKGKWELNRHCDSKHRTPRFRCSVPGCGKEEKRRDKLLIHVRRHHRGLDIDSDSLIHESAILRSESHTDWHPAIGRKFHHRCTKRLRANDEARATSQSLSKYLLALGHSQCNEEISLQATNSVLRSICPTPFSDLRVPNVGDLSSTSLGYDLQPRPFSSDKHRIIFSDETGPNSLCYYIELLRRHVHLEQLSRADTSLSQALSLSGEQKDCDVPVDGDQYHNGHHHGVFNGFLPTGTDSNGPPNGPWKPTQPAGRRGQGSDGVSNVSSNGNKSGSTKTWPCVCHLFGFRQDDHHNCGIRKKHIANLKSHHGSHHGIHLCWTCFTPFDDEALLTEHRSPKTDPRPVCEAACVKPDCGNYGSPLSSGNHTRAHNNQDSLWTWQLLYRRVHGLPNNVWVPDPQQPQQQIPPELPANHPLFQWSTNVPVINVQEAPMNDPLLLGAQLPNDVNFAGDWASQLPNNPGLAPQMLPPLNDRDQAFRSVAGTLWDRVNRSRPSWDHFSSRSWAARPGPSAQPTSAFEILSWFYADIIRGRFGFGLEVWKPVSHFTGYFFGNRVEVPSECPWQIADAPTPAAGQAGPSTYLAVPPMFNIDPALQQPDHSPQDPMNGIADLTGSAAWEEQTVPQTIIDALHPDQLTFWHRQVHPEQNLTPPQPDRWASNASFVTSPTRSEGPTFSADGSFINWSSPGNGAPQGLHPQPQQQEQQSQPQQQQQQDQQHQHQEQDAEPSEHDYQFMNLDDEDLYGPG